MAVPDGVAFEAIALELAFQRGDVSEDEYYAAASAIVADVTTSNDVYGLLLRLTSVAVGVLAEAARATGRPADDILRQHSAKYLTRSPDTDSGG